MTLGITEYDMDAPLTAIRRLMIESNGLLTIAFRRALIKEGVGKPNSDLGCESYSLNDRWITSPFCQIEPAMAFQLGLPIIVFREIGVIAEGILERGVTGTYLPEFDLTKSIEEYFRQEEWNQLIGKWEGKVRCVYEQKGLPPKLF